MRKQNKIFEVTEDHLKLISASYVDWFDCEYGAACINPKRPYGNGDVETDVCEILGIDTDEDGEYTKDSLKRAGEIHKETKTALQICLSLLEFKPGVYVTTDDICFRTWRHV